MPMLPGPYLAMVADALARVSLVLAAGLLLSLPARRDAPLRHALLVAALVGATLVPVAMLVAQALPMCRLRIELPRRAGPKIVDSETPRHAFKDAVQHAQPTAKSGGEAPRADLYSSLDHPLVESSERDVWQIQLMANVMLLVLLTGAFVRGTGLVRALVRLRQIVRSATPVASDRGQALLKLIQGRVPLRRPLQLLETAQVCSPLAAGIIGDYVLLPVGWAERMGRDEFLAVLSHEAAHLARGDHHVVLLQELCASVLWFHPLVHLFNRVLDRVREEVCDNHAIAVVEPPAYCDALLSLAVARPGAPVRGVTAMWPRHWPLESRIRGILDDRRRTGTRISGIARTAIVMLAASLCGLVALPQWSAAQAPEAVATKRLVKSFPVADGTLLRLENLAGRVEVVPGRGPSVEVVAAVRVGGLQEAERRDLLDSIRWSETPAERGESGWGLFFPSQKYSAIQYPVMDATRAGPETVRHLDREIRITTRGGVSIPSVEFDLRVAVPNGARVEIENVVGTIEAHSVAAALRLSTRHGALHLDDLSGRIQAVSEFGDILLFRPSADAVVRTGSGSIDLSGAKRGQLQLSTRTGRCRIGHLPGAGFRLQHSGARPIDVAGEGVARVTSWQNGRVSELLSRGNTGPSITVNSGTGDAVIDAGP